MAVSVAAASAVILLAVSGLFRIREGENILSDNPEITISNDEGNEKVSLEEQTLVLDKGQAKSTQQQPVFEQQAPMTQQLAIAQQAQEKSFTPEMTGSQEIQADGAPGLRITLMKLKPKEAEYLTQDEDDGYHQQSSSTLQSNARAIRIKLVLPGS